MNTLNQLESTLIGSQEDVTALEEKDSATLLVISDTHGDYDVLCDIIENFGPESDALVFCGDGICDICSYLEDSLNNEGMKAALPPVVAMAKGNGDSARYPIMYKANEGQIRKVLVINEKLTFTAAGRNVFVTHGHRYGVDFGLDNLTATASVLNSDLVFFGHTHLPYWEENSGTLVLNPGSCSRPRGGNPPSFAVVKFPGTTERFSLSFFGIKSEMFGKSSFYPIRH